MKSEIDTYIKSRQTRTGTAFNTDLAESEFQSGSLSLRSRPQVFSLVATTYCNMKCLTCDHGHNVSVQKSHLDPTIMEQLGTFFDFARSVELFGLGEPLVSPSFWKILAGLPRGRGLEVGIHTNGTLLDIPRIKLLLDSALTQINISLDAARSATFQRIRGGDFEKIVSNVRNLVSFRKAHKESRLKILIDMTLMRENIEELPEFVDLAADLGVDQIGFWHLHDTPKQNKWVAWRDGWKFVYEQQLLKHDPLLSNRMVRAAVHRALERKVSIHWDINKTIFFKENS